MKKKLLFIIMLIALSLFYILYCFYGSNIQDKDIDNSFIKENLNFKTFINKNSTYYDAEKNITYVRLTIVWSWDKLPKNIKEDTIYLRWREEFYIQPHMDECYSNVIYELEDGTEILQKTPIDDIPTGAYNTSVKIFDKSNPIGYVKSGQIGITISNLGRTRRFAYTAKYGLTSHVYDTAYYEIP